MRRLILINIAWSCIFITKWLPAQRVRYSPFVNDSFIVAGKAEQYYWIEKFQRPHSIRQRFAPPTWTQNQQFEIYDARLIPAGRAEGMAVSESTLKQYFIGGDEFFDQLLLTQLKSGRVQATVKRFHPQGDPVWESKTVLSFPFPEAASSFLLVRSADRSKILLLCFETVPSLGLRVHAVLFDSNWETLYERVYHNPLIAQPLIQDDFLSYPLESFSSDPLKLANNGEWLMSAPSRYNNNFLLFHFSFLDSGFVYREIRLPAYSSFEDVAMSISDSSAEAFCGVLSKFGYSALKNVEVIHYSLYEHKFDFDSSYRFNTLISYRVRDDKPAHESFIALPGSGFMLLKEYGKQFPFDYDQEVFNNFLELATYFSLDSIVAVPQPLLVNPNGYTRYSVLGGVRRSYDRGDLNLFYFPGHSRDSCWSGLINAQQVTEFNRANLSYLVMPLDRKIFLLYNSFLPFRMDQTYAGSTILDDRGNLTNEEGIIFWKMDHTLSFQHYLQMGENEVMLPYSNYKRRGFAVIRF
jgi:hypothetical protein